MNLKSRLRAAVHTAAAEPFRSYRLFRKYISAFLSILLASFLFLGAGMSVLSTGLWNRDKLALLSSATARVAKVVSNLYSNQNGAPLSSYGLMSLSSILNSNSETLEAEFFLCNSAGVVVACCEEVHDNTPPAHIRRCGKHNGLRFPAVAAAFALSAPDSRAGNPGLIFPERMLIATDPFQIDGKTVGFVVAARPVNKGRSADIAQLLLYFMVSSLAVFVIAFAAVYYISYRLVRPLGYMVVATKKYAKGDFGYRVPISETDELSQLAESFNSMAISLATLEGSRRSFVANVSHELKTPMTSIGGFIDGMLDGTIPPQEHQKYLALVSGEVKRLSRLVTGMLNLSRMEAGELQLQRRRFDLSELLFTTLLSFEQAINKKGIELVGLDSLASIRYYGDKDMLTQVFYNLVDNAVKFTPPGERIELSVRRSKERLTISVKNTGVGITTENIERIFERFYKTDQSRSYDVKGAGLGLYLAKTIVKMHGGKITAESDGASYTKITVTLPEEP
ncbi:MAG: HAMP domain-containing histidine kinase [Oscillospiraceae bacterium]|jgi:signal transduction histidine kinase|nr:HAMP domain-containing histidine kinase [Oscillospiraceae bacterium]